MAVPRTVALAAVAATLVPTAVATAAQAPVVSKQQTYRGTRAPITIPGTGVSKGETLPRGSRVIYRTVTLEGRQTVELSLRARAGDRLRGLGTPEGQGIGLAVVGSGRYVGRRVVRVRAFTDPNRDGELVGRIYALTR